MSSGPPSSIQPELTGISLAVEECPVEESLKIQTDRLSAAPQRYATEGLSAMAPQAYNQASAGAGGLSNQSEGGGGLHHAADPIGSGP